MPEAVTRQATIDFPGHPTLQVERFECVERLSELFEMRVWVVNKDDPIDFFTDLGTQVVVNVHEAEEPVRCFNGLVYEAETLGATENYHHYQLVLRPKAYALTRSLDYRIFQDMSVPDILFKVFGDYEVQVANSMQGSYTAREYCVQYRETDFSFASRLMEEEGMYFYFAHTSEQHTLTLCDKPGSHSASEAAATIEFNPVRGGWARTGAHAWLWKERISSTAETKVTLRHFDFVRPGSPQEGVANQAEVTPADVARIFDMESRVMAPADGETIGERLLESVHAMRRTAVGDSDAVGLGCGEKFTLSAWPSYNSETEYLVVGIRHRISGEAYRSAGAAPAEAIVEIEAAPATAQWRPPFRTPRPVVRGPETAIVTGPSGEEIYTDKHGRVKVRFHWDRSGTAGEKASCWIRVSASWAGLTYGEIFLPRIGQEVIIDFLDGDPDQPVVTGRVYNGKQVPSVAPDTDNTRSSIRSQTAYGASNTDYGGAVSPPTDDPGFNEIVFQDKAGHELMSVRAQRDLSEHVYRDETRFTHRDQVEEIGRKRTTTIHTGDDIYTLEQGNETHTVSTGNMTTEVSKGNQSTTVKMGNQSTEVSMGNQTTEVKMGNISIKASLGKIEMEAMQSIELKVGQSSIKIDQMGVTVQGMMIKAEAQIQIQTKGLMAQHNGDAMMMIKGGITMIN